MFLKLQKSFLCWLYGVHSSKQNNMQDNCQMILSNAAWSICKGKSIPINVLTIYVWSFRCLHKNLWWKWNILILKRVLTIFMNNLWHIFDMLLLTKTFKNIMFSEPYFESMNEDYIRFSIIFCDDHLHYDFIKVAYAYFCLLITDRFE